MPSLQKNDSPSREEKIKDRLCLFFLISMIMNVIPFIYKDKNELMANCYVIIDDESSCVVVDPSCDYDGIINYIRKNELQCRGILLTHTHFDHIKGVDRLINALHVPLFVSQEDEIGLTDTDYNCSLMCHCQIIIKSQATIIYDGEQLNLLKEPIDVITTPFHTKGSTCYYFKTSGLLFSGDTLFRGCIGRTDLSSSAPRQVKDSLAKLLKLPDETKVFPGHGLQTNIGFERKLNPFLK